MAVEESENRKLYKVLKIHIEAYMLDVPAEDELLMVAS